jgi:Tfp pilus assembly protein PilE
MKDNKGFTLAELVVIMAVLAILIGVGIGNLGVLDTYNSRECKSKVATALKNNKMDCLSKSATNTEASDTSSSADSYLLFEYVNNSIYATSVVKGERGTKEKVTKGSKTSLTFKSTTGSLTMPADVTEYRIGFCRSTGALLAYGANGICSEIEITTGAKKRYIYLETKTGKILTEGKK